MADSSEPGTPGPDPHLRRRGFALFVLLGSCAWIAESLPLGSLENLLRMLSGSGWGAAMVLVVALVVAFLATLWRFSTRYAGARRLFEAVAAVALVAAVAAWQFEDRLAGAFGPPAVRGSEPHAGVRPTATFDHAAFTTLLRAHVDDAGLVDYEGLRADDAKLDAYLAAVAEAPFDALSRDGRLALLLNAYNAATLRLVLDHWPVASIRDIPTEQRWQASRWVVAGRRASLDDLEHGWIRREFVEPRIHFALVCAARDCPPLRQEAYTGDRLQEQLADQTRRVHADPDFVRLDGDTLYLSRIYRWYGGDFEQAAGSVLAFVGGVMPDVAARVAAGNPPSISWLDYDWSLNDS